MAVDPFLAPDSDPVDGARDGAVRPPVGGAGRPVGDSAGRELDVDGALPALTARLVDDAGVVRDAVLREAGGLSLGAALDLAAVVEDAARVLRHAQLVAAGAVAEAYERPLDAVPSGLGADPADGAPLTFGAASRLTEAGGTAAADAAAGAAAAAAGAAADDADAAAGAAADSDAGADPDADADGSGFVSGCAAPPASDQAHTAGRLAADHVSATSGASAAATSVVSSSGTVDAAADGASRSGRSARRAGGGGRAGGAGRRAGYRTPAEALRVRLRLSGAEARARMVQARDVLPTAGLVGQVIGPVCPLVADLVADGAGDPDAVRHILGGLERIRAIVRVDAAQLGATGAAGEANDAGDGPGAADDGSGGADGAGQVAAMEQILVDAAREVDADDVRQLVARCVHLVDQDGPAPSEADLERLQGVFFSGRRDGLHQIRIITDDAGREVLETIFGAGTNPRVRTSVCDPTIPLRDQPSDDNAGDPAPEYDVVAPTPRPARASSTNAAAGGARSTELPADGARSTDLPADGVSSTDLPADGVSSTELPADGVSSTDLPTGGATDTDAPTGGVSSTELPAEGVSDTGVGVAPAAELPRDGRTVARRRLDALLAACGAALKAAALPATGGLPTQVMVTVSLQELQAGLGSAQLPYTGPVPVRAVRRWACDAGIVPVVLGTTGRVLDVGRTRRLFPDQIRRALVARDGGCAFPGCQAPAPWCEAHHIVEWWNDGVSSIDNAVLLCPYHHHLVHDGRWRIAMVAGMPRFMPPWREPTHPKQAPYRNTYHRPPLPPRRT